MQLICQPVFIDYPLSVAKDEHFGEKPLSGYESFKATPQEPVDGSANEANTCDTGIACEHTFEAHLPQFFKKRFYLFY